MIFWYLHACQREIVICSLFFEYRYFQSRPEIFANLSNGSQASPAVSAAVNRAASDVASKMVMGGLRNAVASNNASRSGANANTNNTAVSSFFFGRVG